MSNKRKQYSPEFKAKIALQAIRGEKTASELGGQRQVHPTMSNTWKQQLLQTASNLVKKRRRQTPAMIDRSRSTSCISESGS